MLQTQSQHFQGHILKIERKIRNRIEVFRVQETFSGF